ncbi:MAG TPA: hypothetical protein VKV32_11815, partial [Stellaceae bacterium]|nr:hypothetical protein [Stellaceae bacterium]
MRPAIWAVAARLLLDRGVSAREFVLVGVTPEKLAQFAARRRGTGFHLTDKEAIMAQSLDKLSLSDAERSASERIKAGEVADFVGAAEKPPIRAAVLDVLALSAPPRGIRVRGARIDGALDLRDAPLNVLALDDCDIAETLQLDGAKLGRLSIVGSRHSGLRARGATIEGQVDFAGARPLAKESWIDLGSAHIRGSVDGCDAQLEAPPARAKENVPPWDHNYA